MPLLVPRVALASSIHPPAHPLRALQHHPSYSRARCPCVAIYIKRWSVASRSAETRASVAEGRPTEKEKALGKGGRVEREGGTCVPPSLSLSPSRSHATDRGEDRPKIRGYETQRRPNTRQRFARQKRDFLDPCLSIANPSHLAVLLSLSCTRSLPTFPGYLPNFPIFQASSLSLFLCLFLSFAFPRSCFLSTPTSSLSLSLSLISFANFLADPISRNEREWTTRTYTATYCVRFTRADLLGRKSDQRIGFYRFYPGVEECVTEISSLEAGTR